MLRGRVPRPNRKSGFDAVAACSQRLLANASHRKDQAAQSDLARHGDVFPDLLPTQRRHDRGRHRDASGWTILGNRARGDVQMEIVLIHEPCIDAEIARHRLDVANGGASRLLHHVAELSGEREVVVPIGQQASLDEEYLATHLRPSHAGLDPRPRYAERNLLLKTRWAEEIRYLAGLDHFLRERGRGRLNERGRVGVWVRGHTGLTGEVRGDSSRHLTDDRANLPL